MPNVLITGANKGIGRGLVEKYLSRPQTTVLATVRDPESPEAVALRSVPGAAGSKTILLKIESTSDTDPIKAVRAAENQGIDTLDVVIANAGIFSPDAYKPVSEMRIVDLQEHLEINAIGPIRLFQAVLPLLKKAQDPKFIVISSLIGTIGGLDGIPFPNAAYGASKAASNYLTRKIHFENEGIVSFAIHPGAVKTESGNKACQSFGIPEAFVEITDSVNGVVDKIDKATKTHLSGEFLCFDDTPMKW